MLKIVQSTHFKKDLKLAKKRGFNLDLLDATVSAIARGETLPVSYHDHPLKSNLKEFRECHIKPDWLLIYRVDNKVLELYLFRTGTHSDLYKK
ncbi:MAG: type II toxin-antitoxin system YafQ family toxin [Bacilli bacterium]|nr:type II toxin-antitoxin system YafQ family toxin [Bacilli bacterium]